MKTTEEIKKGLECCGKGNSCRNHCPYDGRSAGIEECTSKIARDALAYIQQLESRIDTLSAKAALFDEAMKAGAKMERERDAAVESLRLAFDCCKFCKHLPCKFGLCQSTPKTDHSCFEWRGVKED